MLKKLLLLSTLSLSICISSCSDDDSSSSNDMDIAINPDEDKAIELTNLENGIVISGATINQGAAPVPTENVDFQINTDENEAYQKAGFNISFSSTDDIAGAYIQFKDVDGNPTNGYFDVPVSVIEDSGSFKKLNDGSKKLSSFSTSAKLVEDEGDLSIDVDFEDSLSAGRFCYDICLYDSNNNISTIETVCVTIEAWGGNPNITGEWTFDSSKSDVFELDTFVIDCENGDTKEADYSKTVKDEWTFVLNEDGSYYEIYDTEIYELDYEQSALNCEAIYYEELTISREKYSGNWAYNEEVGTLTAVDFLYEDLIDNNTEEFENGGELYLEGIEVEIISGQLVFTDQDGYKAYFNKN